MHARTDGMPARSKEALITEGDVTQLYMERDHPRLLQGPPAFVKAWRGNVDCQVLLSVKKDLETVKDLNEDVFTTIERIEQSLSDDAMGENDNEHWKFLIFKLGKLRKYVNRGSMLEVLIDYLASYACKGEMSTLETINVLKQLVSSPDLPGSPTFKSLAIRFINGALKKRAMPAQECAFLCTGSHLWGCSRMFSRVSLNLGSRALQTECAEDMTDEETDTISRNAFDKFLHEQTTNPLSSRTFDRYNCLQVGQRKVVPVYSYARMTASWPLTEEYSRTMLTLHKPRLQSVADIKGVFDTYVEAFSSFLRESPAEVPPGLFQPLLLEAYMHFIM